MLLDLKYRRGPGVTQRDIQVDNYNFLLIIVLSNIGVRLIHLFTKSRDVTTIYVLKLNPIIAINWLMRLQ